MMRMREEIERGRKINDEDERGDEEENKVI